MVKFFPNPRQPIKRRGISTIVGGLIFLILLTTGFSAFYVALDTQMDTVDVQRKISISILEKTQEQFAISAGVDESDNNRLGIQVSNKGTNAVEISNIWIINQSEFETPPYDAKSYDVNYEDAFIPQGYGTQILEKTPIHLNPNTYDIKVVSTLGTIHHALLTVGGANNLKAELLSIPPDVRIGENATIALRVTNIGDTVLEDVSPANDPLAMEDPPGSVMAWQLVSPSTYTLKPAESAFFTWHVKVTGTQGNKVTFTNYATGTESVTGFNVQSNQASDKLTLRIDEGGEESQIIKDELFAKPEIFMLVPNPFGDDNELAFWGISIANPTDAIMYVSKVTVSVLFAGANDNQKIFDDGCTNTPILPTTGTWDCPNQNQLVWKNLSSPQPVEPRSVYTFLVKVIPGDIVGGADGLDSVVLHTHVFTTLGSFGKSAHQSSMSETTDALVNVYLSTTVDSIANSDIRGNRTGIVGGTLQTFNIVLSELNISSQHIQAGAQLIINIPKDWGAATVTGNTGFINVQNPPPFPDGSSQITADLEFNLLAGGKTITFTSTAPSPLTTKMYVMHVLANGETSIFTPIGPVAEIVLQVCGQSGCP